MEHDVSVVEKTSARINFAVWGIAAGVMTYGAINVMPLLIEHGVLKWTAPGLPLMVDLAMCAGLWGDRVMHRYGRTAAWVTALRWITAAMTLALNVAGPVLSRDYVGLGIHACGPLLILVVAEAAGCFQRIFAEIGVELLAEIDGLRNAASTGTESLPPVETGSSALGYGHRSVATGRGDAARRVVDGTRDQERVAARHDVPVAQRAAVGEHHGSTAGERVLTGETGTVVQVARARDDETEVGPAEVAAAPGADSVRETTGRDQRSPGGLAGRRERETRQLPRQERARDGERRGGERGPGAGRDRDLPGAVVARDETGRRATDRETLTVGLPGEVAEAGQELPDAEAIMWEHFQVCVAAGQPVDGAVLDLVAGTKTYGRRMLRKWVETGRITEQERAAARVGQGSAAAAVLDSARSEEGGQPDSDDSPLQVSMSSGAGASR